MVVFEVPVNGCNPVTIVLGRRGTYNTQEVTFDLSYLVENYGAGTAVLMVKRSQDTSAYPAVVSQESNTLTWVVSNVDTYYPGSGECELMWYVDEGLAKTIIYPMVVMRDILQTTEEPPDGYENWIEHLTELGAETQQNAQEAKQSATEAKSSEDSAAKSAQRAEDAAGLLTDVSATATTLNPGQPATAEYNDGVFEFGIPKGDKLTYADLTEADKEDLVQGPIKDAQDDAVEAVGTAKTTAVGAVNQAGTTNKNAVTQEGTTQVNTVREAGTTQVGRVTTEGNTQVGRVQDKGDEVIGSIPSDYSDLADDVSDLTRQISDVEENQIPELKNAISKNTGTEVINNFVDGSFGLNGATENLTPRSRSGYSCAIVECSAGEVFTIAGSSESSSRLFGFVDASQSQTEAVLLNAAIRSTLYPMTVIVAPANTTHLLINKVAANNSTFFACKGVAVGESISNLDSIVTALGYTKITQEETTGKYLYSTGQAGSSGSLMHLATACVTKPFQLKKGCTIFVKCRGGSNPSVMWVIGKCNDANYSGIKVLVPTIDNAERVYTYTVTEDAYYFCSYMQTYETLSHFSAEIYVCTSTGFLLEAVSGKQDKLTAGENITIEGNVISASGGSQSTTADKLVVDGAMVYKNEIKNGDFSNALTDWTVSPANVFSVVDGEMVLNSSGGGLARQEKVIPSGHNVYIAFDAYKVGNETTLNIFMIKTGGNSILYSESLTDTLTHYAKVSTTSGATRFFQIGGSSGGVAHIDNVFVFDLTAYFGAGNEPTASEFEALLNATQEYTTEQYAKFVIDTASDIQEAQLSAEVQIKLNAETTQGNSKWVGKKIGCLGDSITAFDSAIKKYYQYIVDYYPMASFTVQAVSGATISSYYSPIYAKVADLDSDCDIVTVLGGTNDFQHDVALGSLFTESNGVRTPTTDTSTFYGALNMMIQALIAKFPTKRILLMTPLHRGAVGSYPSEYQQNGLGKYFDEYVEAVKKAGAFWSVPVLDLYNDVGINPNVSQQASAYFTSDLLHPNTAGHARMAEIIEGKMDCL